MEPVAIVLLVFLVAFVALGVAAILVYDADSDSSSSGDAQTTLRVSESLDVTLSRDTKVLVNSSVAVTVTITNAANTLVDHTLTVLNVGSSAVTVVTSTTDTINGRDSLPVVSEAQLCKAATDNWVTLSPQQFAAVDLVEGPAGTPVVQDTGKLYNKASSPDLFWRAAGGPEVNLVAVGPSQIESLVIVHSASDLAGVLDSTKVYLIDGVINMGAQSVDVPASGLQLQGYGFDVSKLTSSAGAYTLFTSPVGGSGNLLMTEMTIEITGAGSQVYDLTDASGSNAVELLRVNFDDCASLGTLTSYRQGLETGTGRFGGTPTLTLEGAWPGGFLIDTSIVRGLDAGMTTPLFAAGAAFVMQSRFRSNQNVDLPALPAFLDFAPANFPVDSTLQLAGCLVSRNGVFDASDSTLLPNVAASDLASSWSANNGVPNTFVGGQQRVTVAAASVIGGIGTFVDLNGTWTPSDLQHFDAPVSGRLRHIGSQPIEFALVGNLTVDGPANDVTRIRVRKFDSGLASTSTAFEQTRVVNNLAGGNDVAFFSMSANVMLKQNDYVFLDIANDTSTGNLTALISSSFAVNAR
jgi:hypothetical protein